MLEVEGDDELLAVEARFRALVHEWDLSRSQVAALLGVDADELGLDLVPRVPTASSERRLRMLVEIRGLLPGVAGGCRRVPVWLRTWPDGLADAGGPLPTPLAFMCGPTENIREMLGALRAGAAA